MEMFDQEITTLIKADEKEWIAEGASQEMKDAVSEMKRSWKEFREAADSPIAAHDYQWWKALVFLALAEDHLKEQFLGRDRSPASVKQFHRWRMSVIFNRPYRADI